MGDTAYMLIEFPTTHKPHFIKQTLYALQEQGILPLIAHIERYPYVLDDPTLLYEWVAAGAYAQINAGALLQDAKLRKKLCKFISWGLVHVLSTDTPPDKRPPRMAEGIQMLQKTLWALRSPTGSSATVTSCLTTRSWTSSPRTSPKKDAGHVDLIIFCL